MGHFNFSLVLAFAITTWIIWAIFTYKACIFDELNDDVGRRDWMYIFLFGVPCLTIVFLIAFYGQFK